jgi:hypothetical protein
MIIILVKNPFAEYNIDSNSSLEILLYPTDHVDMQAVSREVMMNEV